MFTKLPVVIFHNVYMCISSHYVVYPQLGRYYTLVISTRTHLYVVLKTGSTVLKENRDRGQNISFKTSYL